MLPSSSRLAGRPRRRGGAFSLVELLTAVTVFSLIMTVLLQVITSSSDLWRSTTGKAGSYQAARGAFEAMTRNLSQATLQTYLSYADREGNPVPLINPAFKDGSGLIQRHRVPTQYLRASELHFLSGPAASILAKAGAAGPVTEGHAAFFQAALGFVEDPQFRAHQTLLTVCGYYVEFLDDEDLRPAFLGSLPNPPPRSFRYRLVEVMQPAESNAIYSSTSQVDASGLPVFSYDLNWIASLGLPQGSSRHILADNVVLLLFLPKLSPEDEALQTGHAADGAFLAPHYSYDSRGWEDGAGSGEAPAVLNRSRNQLPPLVEVSMVVLDEASAARLAERYGGAGGTQPPLNSLRGPLGLDSGFHNPAARDGDLARFEKGLQEVGCNYRIFRTDVAIQGAKWSP